MRQTSSTLTRVKLWKRPEVNNEPFHLWYVISSVGVMQLPVPDHLQLLPGHWPKNSWIS